MKKYTGVKTHRYWHADFPRGPYETLGITVGRDLAGLKVKLVHDSGAVVEWNKRCLQTFPPDAIREGDVIISVNGVGHGAEGPRRRWKQMGAELNSDDILLEMRRPVTGQAEAA